MRQSPVQFRLAAGMVATGLVDAIPCVGVVGAERFRPQAVLAKPVSTDAP
jgi:hypothetical protein